MTVNYLRATLRLMLVALWFPALALASALKPAQVFGDVDGFLFGIIVVLSSLSGATALLHRIDKQLGVSPGAKLPRPILFVVSHMMGSWLACALVLVLMHGRGIWIYYELAAIVMASFGGAKFVESMAEKWLITIRGTL